MGFWDAVASAGPYANYLHLTSDITTPTPHHSIFTGRMLFLMLNQPCQNNEGTENRKKSNKKQTWKTWLK